MFQKTVASAQFFVIPFPSDFLLVYFYHVKVFRKEDPRRRHEDDGGGIPKAHRPGEREQGERGHHAGRYYQILFGKEMKREFKDLKLSILCPCGRRFPAFAESGVLVTNGETIFWKWSCPDCGRMFQEETKEPILLDPLWPVPSKE